MRLLSLMVFLMGTFLMQPVFAAPQWETKSYQSQGTDYPGYYGPGGMYPDKGAEERCRYDEAVVTDVLSKATAKEVQIRCEVTDIYNKNGWKIPNVWVLKGSFKVLVE